MVRVFHLFSISTSVSQHPSWSRVTRRAASQQADRWEQGGGDHNQLLSRTGQIQPPSWQVWSS